MAALSTSDSPEYIRHMDQVTREVEKCASSGDKEGLLRALEAGDIERMFVDAGKGKSDSITEDEFVDLISDFIGGDAGMHDIVRDEFVSTRKKSLAHESHA